MTLVQFAKSIQQAEAYVKQAIELGRLCSAQLLILRYSPYIDSRSF
jgi:hypothetical protein